MKQELTDANRNIENLLVKLNLKELRDQEIEKLKKKAQEFEEFMRSNARGSSSTSSSRSSPRSVSTTKTDVSTETSDLNSDVSSKIRAAETKVRDEMAKIYASEMKLLEKSFQDEVEQLQNRIIVITEDLEEKTHELGVRHEQLNLLKFTIIQEREDSEKLLKEKDDDFKNAIEKYRVEFESNQQKVEDLMTQLNEKKELIDEERLSIERLKSQISEERKSLANREEETLAK